MPGTDTRSPSRGTRVTPLQGTYPPWASDDRPKTRSTGTGGTPGFHQVVESNLRPKWATRRPPEAKHPMTPVASMSPPSGVSPVVMPRATDLDECPAPSTTSSHSTTLNRTLITRVLTSRSPARRHAFMSQFQGILHGDGRTSQSKRGDQRGRERRGHPVCSDGGDLGSGQAPVLDRLVGPGKAAAWMLPTGSQPCPAPAGSPYGPRDLSEHRTWPASSSRLLNSPQRFLVPCSSPATT